MDLSLPPIGINALAVTKSRISVTPELSQVAGHCQRSLTSQRDTLNVVTSLVAFLLHAIRQAMHISLTIREFILHSQIRELTALALTKTREEADGVH